MTDKPLPTKAEVAEFKAAIWRAYYQLFLTYDEAIDSIDRFAMGLLRDVEEIINK